MELFSLVFVIITVAFVLVLGGIVAVVVASFRQRKTPMSLPSSAPLGMETVETISQLVRQDRTIEAIKVLRAATGLDLVQARNRILGWSDVLELEAAQRRRATPAAGTVPHEGLPTGSTPTSSLPPEEQIRVEVSAVLATSGWHTAETFLREQRGYSPEAAKALLDSMA